MLRRTANEFAKDNTNVVKLYSTLVHDRPAQCTYYHPGVGTMEPPGALTPWRRLVTRTLGLAVGAYLENDIRDAYAFLMGSYEPDDRVFMFGFSRGAYTVRAVASLLYMYGLLRPGNEALIPYAIRMMMAIQRAGRRRRRAAKVDDYFALAREFKRTVSRECKPWFLGVWDTVSSVGWIENPLHSVRRRQSRHRARPACDRHRRTPRIFSKQPVAARRRRREAARTKGYRSSMVCRRAR